MSKVVVAVEVEAATVSPVAMKIVRAMVVVVAAAAAVINDPNTDTNSCLNH